MILPTIKPPRVVHERRPNTSTLLSLGEYDKVIVSFSGGKDSLASVLDLIDRGVDRDRIELWHQCVDGDPSKSSPLTGQKHFFDWPVTTAYCRAIAKVLGVRIRFQWRIGGFEAELLKEGRQSFGVEFELLDGKIGRAGGIKGKVGTRRQFPQVSADLSTRWCSSSLKIDVADLAINNDPSMREGNVLYVSGERREESDNRSRYAEIERHRCTNRRRRVDRWRNVIDWSEAQVWAKIEQHRIRAHPAYYCGFSRLSCACCIFGNGQQWASAAFLLPKQVGTIMGYENVFGRSIKRNAYLPDVMDGKKPYAECLSDKVSVGLATGTSYHPAQAVVPDGEPWTLPAGAYRQSAGPT